jgi:hypothetical protein
MATATANRVQVEFPAHGRPDTDVSTGLMFALGGVLTVAVFGIAYLLGRVMPFVQDLFMGHPKLNAERIFFQGLITIVWALSMANVWLKFKRLKKERIAMADAPVPEGIDLTDTDKLIEVYERLKARPDLAESLGLTRVARVLAMWINTGDFERTAQYARQQADLDALISDSTFRRNRLFIWAMPLGGFVGTVFGVAAGIGGFSAFLQQATVTADQIKMQVGEITTGLAVAFYCTLLGLMTAGLAAFPSLAAERKEEETLGEIDELVEDRLLSHMPSMDKKIDFPIEEMATTIRESLGGMQAHIKFPMEELAQAIDAGFRRLPNPDRYEEVFSRAIAQAGDLINQKYNEFAQSYEQRVSALGTQLGGKLEAVGHSFTAGTQRLGEALSELDGKQGARLNTVVGEIHQLAGQISAAGKSQSAEFAGAHERYLQAISELDRKEITRWEKTVADFNALSGRLSEAFQQSVAGMDAASARYSEQIQTSVAALNEQLTAVQQLGNEIDKVLRTTQVVEGTLRTVSNSDEFRQALSSLRTHLSASDELLKQLAKPRKVIFQETHGE